MRLSSYLSPPQSSSNVGPFWVISEKGKKITNIILSATDFGYLRTNIGHFDIFPNPPPLTSSAPNWKYIDLANELGVFPYTYNGPTPQEVKFPGFSVTIQGYNAPNFNPTPPCTISGQSPPRDTPASNQS